MSWDADEIHNSAFDSEVPGKTSTAFSYLFLRLGAQFINIASC